LTGPAMTAIAAFVTAVVTSVVTSIATFATQERRLRTELRTEFMAESAVRHLLQHPDWKLRTFEAIHNKVAGFERNDLRKILIRAGAVKFERRDDGAEMWGLIERNQEALRN
jgi:hypothetical protein